MTLRLSKADLFAVLSAGLILLPTLPARALPSCELDALEKRFYEKHLSEASKPEAKPELEQADLSPQLIGPFHSGRARGLFEFAQRRLADRETQQKKIGEFKEGAEPTSLPLFKPLELVYLQLNALNDLEEAYQAEKHKLEASFERAERERSSGTLDIFKRTQTASVHEEQKSAASQELSAKYGKLIQQAMQTLSTTAAGRSELKGYEAKKIMKLSRDTWAVFNVNASGDVKVTELSSSGAPRFVTHTISRETCDISETEYRAAIGAPSVRFSPTLCRKQDLIADYYYAVDQARKPIATAAKDADARIKAFDRELSRDVPEAARCKEAGGADGKCRCKGDPKPINPRQETCELRKAQKAAETEIKKRQLRLTSELGPALERQIEGLNELDAWTVKEQCRWIGGLNETVPTTNSDKKTKPASPQRRSAR